MQVQQYGTQASTSDEEMQQLALLFAEQQLAIQAADDVLQKESEKTLAIFQTTIDTQAAENKVLQNENAMLRERLAAMEAQKREAEALHATNEKAKDARHAEEVAALEESNRRLQRVQDCLEKIVQEHLDNEKNISEIGIDVERLVYATLHTLHTKQYERAKQGVYEKLPNVQFINGILYYV